MALGKALLILNFLPLFLNFVINRFKVLILKTIFKYFNVNFCPTLFLLLMFLLLTNLEEKESGFPKIFNANLH